MRTNQKSKTFPAKYKKKGIKAIFYVKNKQIRIIEIKWAWAMGGEGKGRRQELISQPNKLKVNIMREIIPGRS